MSSTVDEDTVSSLVASYESTLTSVSVKAVASQVVIMSIISVGTVLAFSFFRPRQKKVYAPKIKYQIPRASDLDDADYEPPPPPISNGFFAWFSPVIHLKEEQMIANVGLDATTFLRFLRLLRWVFTVISVYAAGLLVVNIVYNLKYVNASSRNTLSTLTIENVSGGWMWSSVAASYLINFTVMFLVWRHWQAMVALRHRWFRSPAYQTKIYSRTLMVTRVRKDFRSDDGLVRLMGLLKVDGIKIGPEIDCTTIGRRLGDFPKLVDDHNEAVEELEKNLVKYLKNDQVASKRPTLRKGGFLGMGGEKKDAIDYLAKQIKYLRDKVDERRAAIDSLLRKERKSRKSGRQGQPQIEGENYGFVTFKTIAEAHRIALAHRGPQKELFGAILQLAPAPADIVWDNISKEPAEINSARTFGFIILGVVCFFNTLPLLLVSLLANLSVLTVYVSFLKSWQDAGQWGDWTFSLVSGILPSAVSALFGWLLPVIMRRISKYQGAPTRSRLDRAVTARYFFFMVFSNFLVFSLLGVLYTAIADVVNEVGEHQSASEILDGLKDIPDQIQGTYVQQSTYWLTWLPLRGFLIIFELVQLIKLALVSLRRVMFSHTPRAIRDMTKPPFFEYPIVATNLLFIAAVGMMYAPIAPLVAIGATLVFWFSSVVYKYQLLYVYMSRAESGGRMWNVYVNRLLTCVVLMQLLEVLTTGLIRERWLDCIAAAPPIVLMLVFKVYMSKTAEYQFRYYQPTSEEAQAERNRSHNEKRTRHAEMERRFLHPALQHDKLFTIMVHKSQEALAREVLSAYPWFAGKHEHDGVGIKAVREENLEYDPTRDGPVDERSAHPRDDDDARSLASTDMLGAKSEMLTVSSSMGEEQYRDPYGASDAYSLRPPGASAAYASRSNLPFDNPSTDQLLPVSDRSDTYGPTPRAPQRQQMRDRQRVGNADEVLNTPLLDSDAVWPSHDTSHDEHVPYPPSAYTQPPIGYTPPTLRRTATDTSDESGAGPGDLGQGHGYAAYSDGYARRDERGPYGSYGSQSRGGYGGR
ncbi:hypothetical protein Q5752_004736 [Cryptotrichosporon argae]